MQFLDHTARLKFFSSASFYFKNKITLHIFDFSTKISKSREKKKTKRYRDSVKFCFARNKTACFLPQRNNALNLLLKYNSQRDFQFLPSNKEIKRRERRRRSGSNKLLPHVVAVLFLPMLRVSGAREWFFYVCLETLLFLSGSLYSNLAGVSITGVSSLRRWPVARW